MFVYIGGYQIGFGPIAWLLISEVFPLEVRGQAVAVAVQTNFFWNVVTSYLFPIATSAIGEWIFFPPLSLSLTHC
jgi:K+-transporting ATPase c subunit